MLVRRILGAGEPAAFCLVPPGVRDYVHPQCPDSAPRAVEARRAEARSLLAAAGFGPQRPLTLSLRINQQDTQKKIALAMQSLWRSIGARTQIVSAELKVHQAALQQGDFAIARAAWYAEDRDPLSFLALLDSRSAGLNLSGYADPQFDALLDQANATVDLGARARLLASAEALMLAAQPVIPLYYYVSRRLVATHVHGWVDNPRGVHLSRYLSVVR